MAQCVAQLQRSGTRLRDVVVLARTHALAAPAAKALRQAGLACVALGEGSGDGIVERGEVQDLLGYLRLLCSPADDAALERVVNRPPRGIGSGTLASLRAACGKGVSTAEAVLEGRLGGVQEAFGHRAKLLVRVGAGRQCLWQNGSGFACCAQPR